MAEQASKQKQVADQPVVVDTAPHATGTGTEAGDSAPASGNNTQTKSGAKKEAKRLEKLAQKAAKAGSKPAPAPAAAGGATGQGQKERKAKAAEKADKADEEEVYVNVTPEGQKKDVSGNMSKSAYNPLAVESAWYAWWQAEGFFQPRYAPTPDNPLGLEIDGGRDQALRSEGTFVIPQPPPNVTGALHTGHALGAAVQDTIIRWERMRGKTVLHNPGYDHAGISTQSVVENRLLKHEGKSRHDYGRDAFLEKVWEWKEVYQKRITAQTTRIGTSSDWNRVAFTMDENLSRAVKEAFCGLHEKGLLYRANRLVNWCVKLSTTLSNLEVDQKELTGRTMLSVPGYDPKEKFEFGAITSFAYPIEGSNERIVVATTRPETLLGDTAIAVHPDDPRYTHLHGKFAIHPFIDRRVPIITDPITVDMAFGTGAVKITPAHDPNDYECGKRHNLEFINLMNDDGTYNHNAGPQFQGMKRFHIRTKIIEALKEKGLYVETKDNAMQIPVCSKSGDIIEQVMKPQWWVNCQPLAQECIARFDAGELTIQPKTSERVWYRWMQNVQDWCISRQLWWGHRCPAYLVKFDGEDADPSNNDNWVVGRSEEAAREQAEKLAKGRKFTLEQDDDVLDTWFSSGLWPFSIMGWPNQTPDLEKFYPSGLLETGWDIIPFWVARMQMFGIAFTGKMPFKEVYCHGMVRDAEGRKMSKSLGNVVDPLDLIEGCSLEVLAGQLRQGNLPEKEIIRAEEGQRKLFPKGIPQCGTDALRFALVNYCTGGLDVLLKVDDVAGYRKFCNKLWNATKFCMVKLGLMDFEGVRLQNDFTPLKTGAATGKESLCELWILHKLNIAAKNVNSALERRAFYDATESMHSFWLYELCDVFIEATKPLTTPDAPAEIRESALNTIYTCLESALRLIHPVMPFVSEDLWQRLPRRPEESAKSIMVCEFPQERPDYHNPEAERDFGMVLDCIKCTRALFSLYNLQTNGKTPEDKHEMIVQVADARIGDMILSQAPIVEALVKGCRGIKIARSAEEVPAGCATEAINADVTVHVLVKGRVNASDEIAKLEKKAGLAKAGAEKVKKLESQPNYESTIPSDVRARNSERLRDLEAEIENLRIAVEKFQSLA